MKVTKEKVGLIVVGVAVITNPLFGQYINQGIDWGFGKLYSVSAYIALIAGVYIIGLISWYMWQGRSVTNIPSKKKYTPKVKASEYLA